MLEWIDKTINITGGIWQVDGLGAPIITKNGGSGGILNKANATTFCNLIKSTHSDLLFDVQIINYSDLNGQNVYSFHVSSSIPKFLYYTFTQGSHCSFLLKLSPKPNVHIKRIKIKFSEQEIFYSNYNAEKQYFEIPITFSGNFNVPTFECNILQELENTLEKYYNKTYYGFSKPTDIDLNNISYYHFELPDNTPEQNISLEQLQRFLPIYQYSIVSSSVTDKPLWTMSYENHVLILKPNGKDITANYTINLKLFHQIWLIANTNLDQTIRVYQNNNDIKLKYNEILFVYGYIYDIHSSSFEGEGYPFTKLELIDKSAITSGQLKEIVYKSYPNGLATNNTSYAASFTLPNFLIKNKSINLTKYHFKTHRILEKLDDLDYRFKFTKTPYASITNLDNFFWNNFGTSSPYIIIATNLNSLTSENISCKITFNKITNELILNDDIQHPISLDYFDLCVTARTTILDTKVQNLIPVDFYDKNSYDNNIVRTNWSSINNNHAGSIRIDGGGTPTQVKINKEIIITEPINTSVWFTNAVCDLLLKTTNLNDQDSIIITDTNLRIANKNFNWNTNWSDYNNQNYIAILNNIDLWWKNKVSSNFKLPFTTTLTYNDVWQKTTEDIPNQNISPEWKLRYNITSGIFNSITINYNYYESRIIQENNVKWNTVSVEYKTNQTDLSGLSKIQLPRLIYTFNNNTHPGLIGTIPITEDINDDYWPLVMFTDGRSNRTNTATAGFIVYLRAKK